MNITAGQGAQSTVVSDGQTSYGGGMANNERQETKAMNGIKISNIRAGAAALGYDTGSGGIVDQLCEVGLVITNNSIEFPLHLLNSVTWVVSWKWETLDGEKGFGQTSSEVNEMRALKRLKDRLIGMGGVDNLEYEDGKWKDGCGPQSAADEDEWPACEECHAITHDESDGMSRQNAYARLLWNGRLLCDRCRYPDRYTVVPSVDATTDDTESPATDDEPTAVYRLRISADAWETELEKAAVGSGGIARLVKRFGFEGRKVFVRVDEKAAAAILNRSAELSVKPESTFQIRGVYKRVFGNVSRNLAQQGLTFFEASVS